MPPSQRLAYWMSEKKSQKLNWQEFEATCKKYGFELFKLDLNVSLESQEPFCAILHKLTDVIAASIHGDINSKDIINRLDKYIKQNPSVVVIDPIPNVEVVLDRYQCYSIIRSTNLDKHRIFTPNFCVFHSTDLDYMKQQLINAKVSYPFICKPILGHGSRQAHKMSIIFNEKHLIDCKIPCVAQSLINHNAILYKIFIVGEKFCYVKRPSLKNFYTNINETMNTIHFDSSDVSKADSQSSLSVLDPNDVIENEIEPDNDVLDVIVSSVRHAFRMDLIGVDVVIANSTGKYAIIDVNVCPGYDGFPNFFEAVVKLVSNKVSSL